MVRKFLACLVVAILVSALTACANMGPAEACGESRYALSYDTSDNGLLDPKDAASREALGVSTNAPLPGHTAFIIGNRVGKVIITAVKAGPDDDDLIAYGDIGAEGTAEEVQVPDHQESGEPNNIIYVCARST
jgi:hypothetical protein